MHATRSRYLPMSDTLPDATRLMAKSLCDMKPVFWCQPDGPPARPGQPKSPSARRESYAHAGHRAYGTHSSTKCPPPCDPRA
jgi:hypothetical protein